MKFLEEGVVDIPSNANESRIFYSTKTSTKRPMSFESNKIQQKANNNRGSAFAMTIKNAEADEESKDDDRSLRQRSRR
ncbi:hypothetical protein HJC23_001295 [Cyclotella cryptica]|uniref:Uncharacterized protein n=1 Tax=Cyclotella cryptica TaxID=29204 RepID=A0ABD3PB64_9STRA